MKIPLVDPSRQYKTFNEEINKIVNDTFLRGDFILGENVEKFEKEFAKFCGVKYCIGVASGTDALLLSLRALGVGPGDEVITTAFTFIATVLPIIYLGAKPVFIDINPNTYQIDIEKIKKAITKKTKVIIPVHLFGMPAPIQMIVKLAKKYKLHVLEDACQAHGASVDGKKCGAFGILSAFSFYPTKSLGGAGDGGAIVTNNRTLANIIRAMRNVGQFKRYKHDILGYNSRLDTLQAGILLMKLRKLEEWNTKREKLFELYNKLLAHLPVILPPTPKDGLSPNYLIYTIRTKKRNQLFEFLKRFDISCAVYYPIPVHLQKVLRYLEYKKGDFPNAEMCAREVLSLPMFPELRESEIRYICAKVKEFFKKER